MKNKEYVVLVDENDHEKGEMEKMEAHEKGLLHRAFSIFIFNKQGQLILQRRALTKYHSPGEWANTCCSHPRKGESVLDAGHRRLQEEMGFDAPLEEVLTFVYKADVGKGLVEHELDHVLIGTFDGEPSVNPDEVDSWKAADLDWIREDVKANPKNYAPWFRIIFEKVYQFYINQKNA
jgi:isopentenyl-diphosphate delta-isomerase